MKILVTGVAGFIGSHLVEALLQDGHDIIGVDNLNEYYDPRIKEARLSRFADRITFEKLDITDGVVVERLFERHTFDAICHLAAQAGVRYSIEFPHVYAESNVVGTLNILECAKKAQVPQIVLASTSAVYGTSTKMPFLETDNADTPMSIYAATKRSTELLAHSYHHLFGMNITVLRFFTVYGPWGRPDMALFIFAKKMLAGETIDVFNNGEMKRDFTYVSDIVAGFKAAASKPLGYEIINLGRGSPVHLLDFIAVIEKKLGIKAKTHMMPMQPGDVPATWADTSKAKELLGWEARVSIEEGVSNFIDWYREYYNIPQKP